MAVTQSKRPTVSSCCLIEFMVIYKYAFERICRKKNLSDFNTVFLGFLHEQSNAIETGIQHGICSQY